MALGVHAKRRCLLDIIPHLVPLFPPLEWPATGLTHFGWEVRFCVSLFLFLVTALASTVDPARAQSSSSPSTRDTLQSKTWRRGARLQHVLYGKPHGEELSKHLTLRERYPQGTAAPLRVAGAGTKAGLAITVCDENLCPCDACAAPSERWHAAARQHSLHKRYPPCISSFVFPANGGQDAVQSFRGLGRSYRSRGGGPASACSAVAGTFVPPRVCAPSAPGWISRRV